MLIWSRLGIEATYNHPCLPFFLKKKKSSSTSSYFNMVLHYNTNKSAHINEPPLLVKVEAFSFGLFLL